MATLLYPPLHLGEMGMGVMGASNGRAHYLADHLLRGGRNCLSVPDTDTVNRPESEWKCSSNLAKSAVHLLCAPSGSQLAEQTLNVWEMFQHSRPVCGLRSTCNDTMGREKKITTTTEKTHSSEKMLLSYKSEAMLSLLSCYASCFTRFLQMQRLSIVSFPPAGPCYFTLFLLLRSVFIIMGFCLKINNPLLFSCWGNICS